MRLSILLFRLRVSLPVFLFLLGSLLGTGSGVAQIAVEDLGLDSGFQGFQDNHYRRGRALVAEDFDGDGRVDFFVGNPGDESLVYRNLGPGPDGRPRFQPAQILLQGQLATVAAAADFDNDSDLDLYIGCGGLEGSCYDFLFRNDSSPGQVLFTDVSLLAGIRGAAPFGYPLAHATGGGTWGDYDRDGDPDLYVSVLDADSLSISYKNILWRNNGNGTFSDVTVQADLDYWAYDSGPGGMTDFGMFQNSTWIDADNDGDLDLILNNVRGPNVVWRNLLVEQGTAGFENATEDFSLPGEDLRFPYNSFASAVADFNNDGWQDFILFNSDLEPGSSPYGSGHGLFINQNGQGFYNASGTAGINRGGDMAEMAMGCQAADLNADGIPDLSIGSGMPEMGMPNRLLLSAGMSGAVPVYNDDSALINFDTPHGIDPTLPPYPEIPPFPYRSHGMVGADVDGDGTLELAIANGGPAIWPDSVREPNRLFKFTGPDLGGVFRVELRGNGITDGSDAIGARAYVEIPASPFNRRVYRTVLGGSGFSAQNERILTFGLGPGPAPARLSILWPSGCIQVLDAPPEGFPASMVVDQACWSCPAARTEAAGWLNPDPYGCGPCHTDADCDDGTFCNGAETCNLSTGQCDPGAAPTCADASACTDDSCDPVLDACVNVPPPAPGEVQNLRLDPFSGDGSSTFLNWDPEPTSGAYNLYRSDTADLSGLACLSPGEPGTTALVEDPLEPGSLRFYLVTGANCGGESTLGTGSAGAERPNPSPCP